MGGAHSATGEHLHGDWLSSAWVIDLAGDTHPGALTRALRRESCVFADMEQRPDKIGRLLALAAEFAEAARSDGAPTRIVSLCQYGMNRSALATGLLLRALGLGYPDAIAMMRKARPGALANHAFEAILAEERYPSPGL
jgi:protein-tyrosine phosphatase